MKNIVAGILLLQLIGLVYGQDLPLGYINYYSNEFARPTSNQNLLFSKPSSGNIEKGILHMDSANDSLQDFNPQSVVLIDNNIFGDFIKESRIRIKHVNSDSISGLYLIAGLRDSSNYYMIRLNNYGAGFIRTYNGVDSLLTLNNNFILPENNWLTLKVTRDILSRKIIVAYNGDHVEFTDPNLVMGYIGFGVCSSKLEIDKINVWAPTSIDKSAPVFRIDESPE